MNQVVSAARKRPDEIIADLRAIPKPRLIVISGPSGVGKDTIIEGMRARYSEMVYVVTLTTRPRRPGEIDGVHYDFVDHAEFERQHTTGGFLESANVYGEFYGVPRAPVQKGLARGQDVVIKVDTQGAQTLRQVVPSGIFIFIAPPSIDELAHRLYTRKTETQEVLYRRLQTAQRELETDNLFDYVVFNESERQDQAVAEIMAILIAEKRRIHQRDVEA